MSKKQEIDMDKIETENSIIGLSRNKALRDAVYNSVREQSAIDPPDSEKLIHIDYNNNIDFIRKESFLMECDMMNLSTINKIYGNEIGNKYMQFASTYLHHSIQKYLKAKSVFGYHSGGDEFSFILQDINSEHIESLSHRINQATYEIAEDSGLVQLTHHKHPENFGVGIIIKARMIKEKSPDYDTLSERIHNEIHRYKKKKFQAPQEQRTTAACYTSPTMKKCFETRINKNLQAFLKHDEEHYNSHFPKGVDPDFYPEEQSPRVLRNNHINELTSKDNAFILRVDINHLGHLNVELGREKADEIIEKLSSIINQEIDTSSHHYRTGGAMFDIVMPDTSIQAINELKQTLYDRCNEEIFNNEKLMFSHNKTSITSENSPAIGLIMNQTAITDQPHETILETLDTPMYVQRRHNISYITENGELHSISNDTPVVQVSCCKEHDYPFIASLREQIKFEHVEEIFLQSPDDITRQLFGIEPLDDDWIIQPDNYDYHEKIRNIATTGHELIRSTHLLTYDAPAVEDFLLVKMLAEDPMPQKGINALNETVRVLKQANHSFPEKQFFTDEVKNAFATLTQQNFDNFTHYLDNRDEPTLSKHFKSYNEQLNFTPVEKPETIISTAINSLKEHISTVTGYKRDRRKFDENEKNNAIKNLEMMKYATFGDTTPKNQCNSPTNLKY